MSDWKQKRFWKEVSVAETGSGFTVALDGRRVKTPAKAPLEVPTAKMARAIAAEWDAQEEGVNPETMPFTRSANAAIDKVRHQHGEVADMLADYGDSDLLCYRADSPEGLNKRQAEQWNPALDWAESALGARLEPRTGVLHQPQDKASLEKLSEQVHAMSDFQLAAFHDLVSISGSLILGFAAAKGWRKPEDIWLISRLDEIWQEEQWGPDEEALIAAAAKRGAFLHAKAFFDAS